MAKKEGDSIVGGPHAPKELDKVIKDMERDSKPAPKESPTPSPSPKS